MSRHSTEFFEGKKKGSFCLSFCIRDILHSVICRWCATLNTLSSLQSSLAASGVLAEMLLNTTYLHNQHLILHERLLTLAKLRMCFTLVRTCFSLGSECCSEQFQICSSLTWLPAKHSSQFLDDCLVACM